MNLEWLRRGASLAALILVTVAYIACSPDSPSPKVGLDSVAVNLPEGRAAETLSMEVPDPRLNAYTVTIELPRASDVQIWFQPSVTTRLDILTEARRTNSCEPVDNVDRCVLHFPVHEALSPGTWAVWVDKQSDAPADILLSVEFERVFEEPRP